MSVRHLATALVLVLSAGVASLAADDPYGDPIPDGARLRLGTARLRATFTNSPNVITPDGKSLVATAASGGFNYLDPATGKVKHGLRIEGEFGNLLAFSADGKRGLLVGFQQAVVFDPESGRVLMKQMRRISGGENAMSMSADGKRLAFGGAKGFGEKDKDKPVSAAVWDVDANKEITSVTPAQNDTVYVALSPDGKRFATWGYHANPPGKEPPKPETDPNRLIQFWDAASGKETGKARLTTGYNPASVAFSPDSSLVAISSGDATIHLIDPATSEEKGLLLGRSRQGRKLAFSPDGKTLASAGEDAAVQRWNVADGKRLGTTEPPVTVSYGVRALQFTDNERIVAWGIRGVVTCIWEVPSGKLLSPPGGHSTGISGLAIADGGKEIYTAASDGVIIRWDPKTAKELGSLALKLPGTLYGSSVVATSVTLSADGSRALASDTTGGTAVYDLPSGSQQFVIPGDNNRDSRGSFTADGSKVVQVLASYDGKKNPGRALVWDIASAKKLGGVELPGMGQLTAALSPDGKTLITAGTKQEEKGPGQFIVTGWDLASGKKLGEYTEEGGFGGSFGVAAAGDNKSAVVYSPRGGALVVDYTAGTKLLALDLEGRQPAGPPVMSPDGKSVAVPLSPGFGPNQTSSIVLCDIASGKAKKTLKGASGGTGVLAFSADGKTLVSGAYDTTALVWDISGL
jgi:WD40 repeat protein